jgi:hypothetical protein
MGQTSRRFFLKSLTSGAILAGLSSKSIGFPSLLQTQRSLSISSVPIQSSTQRCISWCWAACAETVVRSYGGNVNDPSGRPIAQEWFAAKEYGRVVCQAATPEQLAHALSDRFFSVGTNQPFILQGGGIKQLPLPPQVNTLAVQLIRNNIPFITEILPNGGNTGHFLVIYGIDYWEDQAGNVVGVIALRAADPFPQVWYQQLGIAPPPTYLDASVYQRFQFVAMNWAIRVG